ncbi:aBC-type metal ion transporter periplasmic subunit [Clostridium sp. CAG:628]|nr:aBC-type metal ion transporter periplasmic subunit [Clostridium sp. CAG:628]
MKKVIVLLMSLFLLTGCLEEEKLDKIAYTTYYPLEFATNYMYKDFATVKSIYPNGIDTSKYTLTDKQKSIYASSDMFVYAGVTDEVKLAAEFLNTNQNISIIDGTKGLSYSSEVCELWLDPSNYLMIARNIKSTLIDYANNVYDEEKIDKLYDELKIKISEIDVDLTMMGKNASKKNILVTNDSFNFLSKYNINVISIKEGDTKSINDAKKLINSGEIKYVYVLRGNTLSEEIETFIKNYNLEKIEIDSMYTITDEDKNNGNNYLSIMTENINKFKTELFR